METVFASLFYYFLIWVCACVSVRASRFYFAFFPGLHILKTECTVPTTSSSLSNHTPSVGVKFRKHQHSALLLLWLYTWKFCIPKMSCVIMEILALNFSVTMSASVLERKWKITIFPLQKVTHEFSVQTPDVARMRCHFLSKLICQVRSVSVLKKVIDLRNTIFRKCS